MSISQFFLTKRDGTKQMFDPNSWPALQDFHLLQLLFWLNKLESKSILNTAAYSVKDIIT
jgi:hypothetical protein